MSGPGLAEGVRAGDRATVARALTLVESRRADHRAAARDLLSQLHQDRPDVRRVGITGVPGVGKSTFIDALGAELIGRGHRVAVLAVDPSSARTGGSILGDKTRMQRLATSPDAFVRPSPTAGTLGGVARATRGSIAVVEAAGFDVVLVETVGVGQSEYVVADMVDTFCFLTLARTGDELQGIKRGILELCDVIAVNKADGPHRDEAERTAAELVTALHLLRGDAVPPVLTCSARDESGLDAVWDACEQHRAGLGPDGLTMRRRRQDVDWMYALVRERLLAPMHDPGWRSRAARAEQDVLAGRLGADEAAGSLIASAATDQFADPTPSDPR